MLRSNSGANSSRPFTQNFSNNIAIRRQYEMFEQHFDFHIGQSSGEI
jgi:hypothetical protein